MKIICHRGYWLKRSEQNTALSFERAFAGNFGIETDIRDYCGQLVISHDVASRSSMALESLLDIYRSYPDHNILAFNIKSDGLQKKLRAVLKRYEIRNYFLFDMSFPEQLRYVRNRFVVFARQSEYEQDPLLYSSVKGVWMDEFDGHWIRPIVVKKHIKNGKMICLASPELHGRAFQGAWNEYRQIDIGQSPAMLMLCTDYPERAKEYFDDKD